uniref:(northern house mosquito) hypothetical protein n=1 Tax=Culex pipiens TaxID=7175 RepID=A0A8D8HCM1_CULPI
MTSKLRKVQFYGRDQLCDGGEDDQPASSQVERVDSRGVDRAANFEPGLRDGQVYHYGGGGGADAEELPAVGDWVVVGVSDQRERRGHEYLSAGVGAGRDQREGEELFGVSGCGREYCHEERQGAHGAV